MTQPSTCARCGATLPAASAFCPDCGKPLGGANDDVALQTLGGLETLGGDTTRAPGADAQLPSLEPGQEFADRYTIRERVGAGGMGVVYRAHDGVADRDVALKLIRPDRLRGADDIRRLIAEGITARDVRHKNVVAVYDVGEAGGQPFLSMEFLEGRSLRAWHRSQKERGSDVSYPVAARIVREVLDGLEAAHERGVVHRDLKPENIVLLAEPSATAAPLKIVDFGIARVAGTASDTGTGSGVGTPRYMAPEQLTQADLAGPAADLYSLSVIFYELLVDVLPQGHWQPPSGGRADVPRGVDALIQAGLSNRPASRPASVAAYREALDAARPAGPGEDLVEKLRERLDWRRALKPDARQRKWWGVAIACILVAAVIGAMLEEGESFGPGPGPGPGPVAEVENLTGIWRDTQGAAFEVYVDPSGYFSGGMTDMNGNLVEIEGQISGRSFQFGMGSFGQQFISGQGQWDGGRRLSYSAVAANGMSTTGAFTVQPR